MKLSPRNKLIAVAVGAGLVVILLVVVLLVPAFNKMQELGTQIDAAEQEAQAAKALLEQRREVKDSAAVTDATLMQLNNAVPANPELPAFIIELQDLAYSTGVSLRAVTPNDPTQDEDEDFVTIPIALEVYGTWADTVDYLQQVRRLPRQVRIADFESTLLDESTADEAGMKMPPYYQVETVANLEIYVIPESTESDSDVPAPAPGQEQ
jgi:Tfp pilus assembly protein PilO